MVCTCQLLHFFAEHIRLEYSALQLQGSSLSLHGLTSTVAPMNPWCILLNCPRKPVYACIAQHACEALGTRAQACNSIVCAVVYMRAEVYISLFHVPC